MTVASGNMTMMTLMMIMLSIDSKIVQHDEEILVMLTYATAIGCNGCQSCMMKLSKHLSSAESRDQKVPMCSCRACVETTGHLTTELDWDLG